MKFSEQWLREWVNPPVDTDTLANQLTMGGLEVEGIESCCPDFSGVVVACIDSIADHPDADRLKVCQVDCGEKQLLNIVCGASNVDVGMKFPLARIGARLPGDKVIAATKLKGVHSEGMLCSAMELGLAEEAEGLLELPETAETGTDIHDCLSLNDKSIELALTPNRGDCLSIAGVAREVAVLNQCEFSAPDIPAIDATTKQTRKVHLAAAEACPRYVGRIISDVDVNSPSPLWLTEKLRRSGIRSINAVVDITNYILLELGQPMHAFDNQKLNGTVTVRFASANEKLVLLDGTDCELSENTLVIADDSAALAMAGIMGGFESAVIEDSREIFLESAFFTPQAIIGRARQYGLRTDSSHRFERGVDPGLQRRAVERATGLILAICGGKAGEIIEACEESCLPESKAVILRRDQIQRVLGIDVTDDTVTGMLQRLGMEVTLEGQYWKVTPPSHRFDIEIEADLIEEIARIYGYDVMPAHLPLTHLQMQRSDSSGRLIRKLRNLLIHRGYQEAITYSFVDPDMQKELAPGEEVMTLTNPIAPELSVMRVSHWPGLMKALQYNLKRQQQRVRLFETGLVFKLNGKLSQAPVISGITYGNYYNNQWDIPYNSSNLYDIKADTEALFQAAGLRSDIEYRAATHAALHPGQSAEVYIGAQFAGIFGALHPRLAKKFDLPDGVYVFEFNIKSLLIDSVPKYKRLSRFPSIRRDMALVVADEIPVAEIMKCIGDIAPDELSNLELFDVYHGEGIEKGKKSLALGLTFQRSSSTLIDEEAEVILCRILESLKNKFGGKLRE
ncbi:MAG: phenylalanine--tRNA ligase subunit beta [Gammaproteobacteria bacterium]